MLYEGINLYNDGWNKKLKTKRDIIESHDGILVFVAIEESNTHFTHTFLMLMLFSYTPHAHEQYTRNSAVRGNAQHRRS